AGGPRRADEVDAHATAGAGDEVDLAHDVSPGQRAAGPRWYSSSLTFSSQSAVLPSSRSWMAMCVMEVVGAAPCQCFSPGENQTTSPGRISSIGPPQRCARPQPAVTMRV